MSKHSDKNGVLNSILSVLNIGLEVVLGLIALGFLIGLWGILN